MEDAQICDELPPLSPNFPWLVAQNLEEEDDNQYNIFYTVHDPLSYYQCRIPELIGRRIRACFHGWMILSNHPHDFEWSLWNPVTSKFIHLPRLILKDGDNDNIHYYCCLSSPPDDPGSILLLIRYPKPNIVFCRLDCKRKRLKWIEMPCSKQLKSITGDEDSILLEPTCCNGKVYALTVGLEDESPSVIQVHIVVKKKKVMISLLPFVTSPYPARSARCNSSCSILKGSCSELFSIRVCFMNEKIVDVYLYKLDMTSLVWTEMKDFEDTVFFVDLASDDSLCWSPPIASELGGYIHILHKTGKVIYSYDLKDRSISMSSMHCLDLPPRSGPLGTSHISIWPISGFRLQGDHGESKCKSHSKQDQEMMVRSATNDDEVEFNSKTNERNNETHLFNIPCHLLEKIMEFCVGVEYLNFRATCKRCHLAAPVVQWSNEKRLQTYSLNSPWLVVFMKDHGIIAFTDPIFGDNYFIKASPELFYDSRILCSRFGWLLLFIGDESLAFFNPFTSDIRKLPVQVPDLDSFCFSAPPTSPDCVVVGISSCCKFYWHVFIYLARGPSWHIFNLDNGGFDTYSFMFPTFCGREVYAMFNAGGLQVFKEIHGDNLSSETVVDESPRNSSAEYFQVKCDQHLLLVIVGEFGESVEVFKLKDSRKEWEKMDGLGRHVIYICGTTCLCMDAKIPEMENKIYFSRLHCKKRKIVFYSLETCRFHTFNGENIEEAFKDLYETKEHVDAHAWIEPSWS